MKTFRPLIHLHELKKRSGVYVLQLEDGSFYVGSSLNLQARLQNHKYHRPTAKYNYVLTPPDKLRQAEDRILRKLKSKGLVCINELSPVAPPRTGPCPGKSIRQQAKDLGIPYRIALENIRRGDPITKKRHPPYLRWVCINGRTRPLSFWARWYGLPLQNISSRIQCGWAVERAITTPLTRQSRKKLDR